MFKIDRINPYKQGYVARGENDAGGDMTVSLCDVRAAVVEPVNDIPCYFLVLGCLDAKNKMGKKPFIYIDEFSGPSINRVFNRLIDDVLRLSIQKIYANRANEGFYGRLWQYRQAHGSPATVQPIVCRNDIPYGDALIGETILDRALITPKTWKPVMSKQVNEIKDIGYGGATESPDYDKYYAWNALRCLLAGYTKYPPRDVPRMPFNDIGNPRSLDATRSGNWQPQNLSQWAV